MKKNSRKTINRQETLEGMMTFGLSENGLRTADFECCEDAVMEDFTARCKVQLMRDGNMYITELPKRVRNKPIFREDNSSLSKLISQASEIAQKVIRELVKD